MTRTVDIAHLRLPNCLERTDDGSVRVAGHRVSLYHILDALYSGATLEAIEDLYPTIPRRKLIQVIDFCHNHADVLKIYHDEQRNTAELLRRSNPDTGPTREELLRRMEQRLPK